MTAMLVVDGVALFLLFMSMVALYRGLRDTSASRRLTNLLYPLSQFLFLGFSMVSLLFVSDVPHKDSYALLLAVCAVLCAVVDVALFRNLREAEDEMLYRERSRMLQDQLRAQQRHFDTLVNDVRTASRLNSVMDEQLDQLQAALDRRDADEVRELTAAAARSLPKRNTFCGHKAVDALCAVKIPAMVESGIECSCEISIGEDCPLQSDELCALFANILDNAANACQAVPRGSRWVWLHAHVVVGCLVIDSRNVMAPPEANGRVKHHASDRIRGHGVEGESCGSGAEDGRRDRRAADEPRGRGLAEHGWGLAIIRRIVARHGGECSTDQGRGEDGHHWFSIHIVIPYTTQTGGVISETRL